MGVDLTVKCGNLTFDNPIIPASGCFGFGYEFSQYYDLNILGSIAIKGTTLQPRYGNDLPRIAECQAGLLNSVGLQNPGLDKVCHEELVKLSKVYTKPIIANISGFSIEEYVTCAKAMDQVAQVGIIEVNISCPNVHDGGMSFGVNPQSAYEVTKAVKEVTTKPVFIKLSPNVTDIVEIATACEQAGADGLVLINTLLGMRIDIKQRRPILNNVMGGYSGPGVFPVALRMVYQVARAVSIPIIGLGGISNAYEVVEMLMAGASAVQIGSANLIDPYACPKIIEELPKVMQELKIESLQSIIGCVK